MSQIRNDYLDYLWRRFINTKFDSIRFQKLRCKLKAFLKARGISEAQPCLDLESLLAVGSR